MKKTISIKSVMRRQYAITKYMDVLIKSKPALKRLNMLYNISKYKVN